MKKLCAFLLMALLMVPVWAGADDIILPEPGYYFGRSYDGYMIEFAEYPKAEFDAYVKLLTEQYGMQITEEGGMGSDEFVFMEKPGVENTDVFVSCFKSEYECGMEIIVDTGITLSALDSYKTRSIAEPGVIAWDDGRIIADPGDFLGYEIDVIGTWDRTGSVLVEGAYVEYKYEEIAKDDILAYAKALHDSPYFEYNGKGIISHNYWLLYFDYTGANEALLKECKGYRTAKGYGNNRKSDLSIYIISPESEKSEFKVYEYPGFTVDSEFVEPDPGPIPEGRERCIFCNGGSCKNCGGSGYVYQWMPGEDDQRRINCSSCMNGRCSFCDGNGWR